MIAPLPHEPLPVPPVDPRGLSPRLLATWEVKDWEHRFDHEDHHPSSHADPCLHYALRRCRAYRRAQVMASVLRRRLALLEPCRRRPSVRHMEAILLRSLAGFCQGERWARAGYPRARVARYRVTARRFDAAGLLFSTFTELRLTDLVADCHRTACVLRNVAFARQQDAKRSA